MREYNNNAEKLAYEFVTSFSEENFGKMAALLDEHLESYVTNASGGVDLVTGRDAYMQKIYNLDSITVKPLIKMTQCVSIGTHQALFMVEVQAERKESTLHNFAAYLLEEREGRIIRLHMVEALPAESDVFWNT